MKSTQPAFEDSRQEAIDAPGRVGAGPNRSPVLGHPRRKGDHVTTGGPENGLGFVCHHCGEGWTITSPAEITSYVAASKVFRARHLECPKPKEKP